MQEQKGKERPRQGVQVDPRKKRGETGNGLTEGVQNRKFKRKKRDTKLSGRVDGVLRAGINEERKDDRQGGSLKNISGDDEAGYQVV